MAKYDPKLLEEELKNKVAADWFAAFDTTRIIGKVDFCVAVRATELGLYESENALWAEAKAGVRKDIAQNDFNWNATSADAGYNERLAALKQCREKRYADAYADDGRRVVYVGVNYDPVARTIGEVKTEAAIEHFL